MSTGLIHKSSGLASSLVMPNFEGPLGQVRKRAWDHVQSIPAPTSRDEDYKYLPLRLATDNQFDKAQSTTAIEAISDLLSQKPECTHRIVFVNGFFAAEYSDGWNLDGCELRLISEADEQIGSIAVPDRSYFSAINTSQFEQGLMIVVSESQTVAPIEVVHVSMGSEKKTISHPRLFLKCNSNGNATVIERFIGKGASFTNSVTEISISSGGTVEHVHIQDESELAIHFGLVAVHQSGGSTFTSNCISLGSALSRVDLDSVLNGENAVCWLNGAYIAAGDQVMDNHTRLDHAMPNCNSFEVYKGVLGGASTGIFNGKICVHQDAQKTDAKQTNQALLLSPDATINTKPQLEIFADDVKCTHGATVGQIREDSLFYLRARGIPKSQARGILVQAFVGEVLEKISHEPTRQHLIDRLHSKLEREDMKERE